MYIHQNPIKAGICKKPEEYEYSSYIEYTQNTDLVDTSFVFGYWSVSSFIEHHKQSIIVKCLDIEDKVTIRVTDEQARELIKKVSKCNNVTEFQMLDIPKRDKCLRELREKGLSIRQLSRLTGTSINIVRKFS